MAVRPVDAAHHHRMIEHHARALRTLAGRGGSMPTKGGKMTAEPTKARGDSKGCFAPKKK